MKKHMGSLLQFSLLLATISGCAKDDRFVYLHEQKDNKVTRVVKVKEVVGAAGVDLLWVVDNSGSMSGPQQNVISNAETFMQEFTKTGVNWKLGLISTSDYESPFLGFGTSVFNHRTPGAVGLFRSAVGSLGTNGDFNEKSFGPILKSLTDNPDFLRPGMALAIIMVTDAPEQSTMHANAFVTQLRSLIGAKTDFYAYGVFGAQDLGCDPTDDQWFYKDSEYEAFIKSANAGRVYPICSPDFGRNLAEVEEIAENVSHYSIYLSSRPDPSTIHVNYKGTDLIGGPRESGGQWYYDFGKNSVVFYTLDFSNEPDDSVTLTYDRAGI